jgi:hypothetical protein
MRKEDDIEEEFNFEKTQKFPEPPLDTNISEEIPRSPHIKSKDVPLSEVYYDIKEEM